MGLEYETINSFRIYDPKKITEVCTNVDVIIVTTGISEQSVFSSFSEYHWVYENKTFEG